MNRTLAYMFKGTGVEVFVKYFDLFSNAALETSAVIQQLPKEYTEKSKKSRTYKAKKVFSENLEVEALQRILSSKRVPVEIIQRAKELIEERRDKLFETDKAVDIFSPPSTRIQTTINRIIRDTRMTNILKDKYEFRCQFTGERLSIGNGRFYAKCHHIVPLGEPHNGKDEEENILCVSPNYHALLDYLAIPINKKKLKLLKHDIRDEFIEYHNKLVEDKAERRLPVVGADG